MRDRIQIQKLQKWVAVTHDDHQSNSIYILHVLSFRSDLYASISAAISACYILGKVAR